MLMLSGNYVPFYLKSTWCFRTNHNMFHSMYYTRKYLYKIYEMEPMKPSSILKVFGRVLTTA